MEYSFLALNTARNSLRYVIRAFNIKEVYLPYYICSAIRNAVRKENCKIIYYHINKNFYPSIDFPQNAFILYPNYFGICSKIVKELSNKYQNLIVDNAHSFYSEPAGVASFNSLRKFFPTLRDGSFLYIKKIIDLDIEYDNFVYSPKILNYDEICKNEQRLDNECIKYISKTTFNSIPESDKLERIQKFEYWNERLKGNISLSHEDFPFAYPYLAKSSSEADKLVSMLNDEGHIIYRYWNNMPDSYPEKIFYTNLVAISLNVVE